MFLGVGSMEAKFNNRDPVYVQVIQHFKEKMAKGYYEPGQEIPSRRELANQLKINPNTAQRAYKEMEEQGLIFTEGNLPSRITKDEQMLKRVREELIGEAVDQFVHSVQTINVELPEVLDLVKDAYEKKKSE
jgi:GntR family transcriptional regulator